MAKEKFDRSKPHVNIGTIGHVDHGKTTLTMQQAIDRAGGCLGNKGVEGAVTALKMVKIFGGIK